ncbi:MAG: hypothetical protein ACIAQZ_04650 [Sedimentisphaeraceae bacterium JB056]
MTFSKQLLRNLLIGLLLSVSIATAETKTVTIPVAADCDIREVVPDTAYGIRTDMVAATSTSSMKIYMRFNLPADFAVASSATVKMVRTRVASATTNLYYNLYGLNDGVAGQDWLETTGYVDNPATVQDGLTWNNAPANSTGNTFTTDALALVNLVMLPAGDNGGAVGSEHDFTSQGLVDFLNSDTDGVVNLMMSRHNTTSAWESFAGKENTTYSGPVLELTYDTINSKTVEIVAVADTDIRQDSPTYAKGDRTVAVVQNSSGKNKKMYIKFQLPVDFGTALAVDFKIVPEINYNTLWNWEYNLFGLEDGAEGNDWPESSPGEIPGQSYMSGVTWENAPGNDPATGAMTSDVTEKLNSFNIYSEVGVDVTAVSSQAMVDFINTDSDGFVTLIMTRTNPSTALDQLATKENTTYAGPRLVITYEPIETTTVTLSAVADTDIRMAAPDYAHSTRTGMWVSSQSTNGMKGYARFTLPTDIGSVVSSTITYNRTVAAGAWNSTYDIYVLNDNAVGNDWPSANSARNPGDPYTMGLTWNNAPGNDTTSSILFDTATTSMLGDFTVVGTSYGGTVGDSYSLSNTALNDAISADTDGAITLMISRHFGESSSMDVFGVVETGAPATLSITYINQCGERLLSDVNYDCTVDYQDYAQMGNDWLIDDPNFFTEANNDVYPDGVIGIADLDMMAQSWLGCSLPGDPDCDQYWKAEYLAPVKYNQWRKSFDTFPIAAWAYFTRYGGLASEYQSYYDAGLTMVQTVPDQYQTAVDAGLYPIMGTWDALYSNSAKLDTFMGYPTAVEENLRGLFFKDDIRDFQIPEMVDATQKVLLEDVRGAIPMVNLLPSFGTIDGENSNTYQEYLDYVDEYIDTVHPAILSCAYYCLLSDENERAGTYDSLELRRSKALANGIGFMAFAIVNEHLGYRSPSESDLNWKVWASLTYGAKAIWYYNWRIEPDSSFGEGMITHLDGTPTDVYYLAQSINTEVQAMGPVLMSLESTGVYHADVADPNNTSITLYSDGDVAAIATFTGSQFVIGEFENVDDAADTSDYVMITSKRHAADKLSNELTSSASFTASAGVTSVNYFDTSSETWQSLTGSGGVYNLSIDGGKSVLLKFNY